MKKLLLVYLPFCTPAVPPFSLTNLYSFLKNNSDLDIEVLDLNVKFHKKKFPKYHSFFKDIKEWDNYEEVATEYHELTRKVYSENNKNVVQGLKPEYFKEFLKEIKSKNPDYIAFSLVYSSQAFYAYSLLKELKEYKTIVGGPAVNKKAINNSTIHLQNEIELLEYVNNKKVKHDDLNFDYPKDFTIYNLKDYFSPSPVIPIKTSSTCFYKKCAFCSHFSNSPYFEYSLDNLKKTIIKSKQKFFFVIDDNIPSKRLLKIAETLKPLKVKYTCQLKPTIDFTFDVFKKLKESGLDMIIWGVESGSNRILKLMRKGTNKEDISHVLKKAKKAGIKNGVYIMFGFPTETKDEFLETIDFIKENSDSIDLIMNSTFGLQKGAYAYDHPKEFSITNVTEKKRTVLEPKISFEVSKGLSANEIKKLVKGHKKTILGINKYPKALNFFRSHMFLYPKTY
jgi:biotin synthase-like enzyme